MDDEVVIVLAFFTVLINGIGVLMNHLDNTKKKTVSKKRSRKSKKR